MPAKDLCPRSVEINCQSQVCMRIYRTPVHLRICVCMSASTSTMKLLTTTHAKDPAFPKIKILCTSSPLCLPALFGAWFSIALPGHMTVNIRQIFRGEPKLCSNSISSKPRNPEVQFELIPHETHALALPSPSKDK